jgi:hypothetical protein
MANPAQLIQIYQMTDPSALASVVEVLSGTGKFKVDTRTSNRGSFLIVEGADPADALNVYELVVVADQETDLIYSTTGPLEQSGSGEFLVNGWVIESQRGLRVGAPAPEAGASRAPGTAGSNT